jgi:hypothetical protein
MEIIKFSDFMNNTYKPQHTPKKIHSISPLVMIDPNVALVAAGIVVVVTLQTVLEHKGEYEVSEKISSLLGLSIPLVALVFILRLFSAISGVFL